MNPTIGVPHANASKTFISAKFSIDEFTKTFDTLNNKDNN
jgi:hypothetical protein